MYAVIATGGKQYRVAEGDVVRIEKLDAELGATVEFDKVLLVGSGSDVKVGAPLVAHPGVDHITFTGSVPTGIGVMRAAAPNARRPVSMRCSVTRSRMRPLLVVKTVAVP
jgi:hypothetical protein